MSGRLTPKRQLEAEPCYEDGVGAIALGKRLKSASPRSRSGISTPDKPTHSSQSTRRATPENSRYEFLLPGLPLPLPLPSENSSRHDPARSSFFGHSASHFNEAELSKSSPASDGDICFGMLTNMQFQFNRLQSATTAIPPEDHVVLADSAFVTLALDFDAQRCHMKTTDGTPLATMNNKTYLALRSLAVHEKIRFRGVMSRAEIDQTLAQTSLANSQILAQPTRSIKIHVYGSHSVSDIVAKELSKFRLFLQHPVPLIPDTIYENPQYFSVPGASFRNGAVLAPITLESQPSDVRPAMSTELTQDEELDLLDLINHLPMHDYLQAIDADSRIKTPLLKHQKEAVDFTMHRESCDSAKMRSLWRPCGAASRTLGYRHIITGTESPKQKDTMGGILADDMGLGKTLTMIANIVSTMSRAEKSASAPRQEQAALTHVKSTLVLVPSASILDGWIDEIKQHTVPGTLQWHRYHGTNRRLPLSSPLPYDIVITTYGTAAADFRRGGGVLNTFHWYRVVLDEAHVIRNSSTQTFEAVTSLSATIRWCITGTPIQNSLTDLGSLVRFLRVPLLEDAATFRRFLSGRQRRDRVQLPNYENIKRLLGSICLRRNMSILMTLGATVEEQQPELTAAERRAYHNIALACKQAIDVAVGEQPKKRGKQTILELILRLRMFCNTGLWTPAPLRNHAETMQPDEVLSLLQQSSETVCSACSANILSCEDVSSVAKDGNIICKECFREQSEPHGNIPSISIEAVDNSRVSDQQEMLIGPMNLNIVDRLDWPSKLLALLANIKAHYQEDKSIVFSFWKRSLDLVGQLFRMHGIAFVRVDGDLSRAQRKKTLAAFCDDASIRVLLITLGTGAVGINKLSVASRVHILEPQWNPSIENQAIGRVLRLNQSKKVYVVRYIVKKSIEEGINSRQIKKLQFALKGGLHPANEFESQRRTAQLSALGSMIDSTILDK